ncbi:MAG: DUF349 domain-containing protein, partial [Thiothrix sp.]|nr:DUF349 domain-containing protein [Thiothrix sp.]
MFAGLFKPKWQSENARVRLQSLTTLDPDSTELIRLALNDPDTGVRLEAIRLLTDLPTLIELGARDDFLGQNARQRVQSLAGEPGGHDERLTMVFAWFEGDAALMERLATDTGRASGLRKLALQTLTDENLLFRIADGERSQDIQYLAASRLSGLEWLKKLEKSQGRNNKRLRQLLRERMEREKQQQARLEELENLCVALEGLGLRDQWDQDRTRQMVLQQRWKTLTAETAAPEALSRRFAEAGSQFQARLKVYLARQSELEPLRQVFVSCLEAAATLETQLREQPEQLAAESLRAEVESLRTRWETATPLPDPAIQETLERQWTSVFEQLETARDAVAGDLELLEPLQRVCQRAESLRQNEAITLKAGRLTDLQSEWVRLRRPQGLPEAVAGLESRFHQSMDSLNARLQRELAQRDERLQAIQGLLDQMTADLEAEKYGEAVDLHQQAGRLLETLAEGPEAELRRIRKRLQDAAPLVREFKDWRRWGTDQAREHLIEKAQELEVDESIDPEERARMIRALRDEWRKLVKMDPGHQRQQWKTFDSKVTAAYESSKQHFVQQAQARDANLQVREQLCEQLEQLETGTDWAAVTDWKTQHNRLRELLKQWKQCGPVGHKAWKGINQRFNAAMDALEVHFNREREANFAERQQLVPLAEALLEQDDLREAAEAAKQLQARWSISLPSRAREEQRLWKQFRTPIDTIFQHLQQERNSHQAEVQQRIDAREAVCVQLEALSDLQDEALLQAGAQLDSLQQAYAAITGLPRREHERLEARWRKAEKALQQRLQGAHREQQLARLDQLATRSAQDKSREAVPEVLAQNREQGELLCLQLEVLLNVSSPPAFQQARLEYQVAHMSEAMRTRKSSGQDTREQALTLLADWYRLGSLTPE